MNQKAERIESLKAGVMGAIASGLMFGLTEIGYHFVLPLLGVDRAGMDGKMVHFPLGLQFLGWQGWFQGAIVLLSGFLFGVTYRYVVRQDSNPHLRTGAVMAFGLVRGLAQVGEMAQLDVLLAGAQMVESVLLFAGAGLVLDWAMQQGWVKAFN
jgi:hypothetical protein